MSTEHKISICIATYNGANKLQSTLNAVIKNTRLPDEVVVYIDGSTDNTLETLNSYAGLLTLKIIEGKNCGRASARNVASRNALNSILMFLDDDIIIPENAIQSHYDFQKMSASKILSAPCFTIENEYDFSLFKIFLEKKWNEISKKNTSSNGAFSAAYFSIKKDDFETLNGFTEGLNDAEDYEFGLRARLFGLAIETNEKLFARHNDYVNCKNFIIRNRQYFVANQKLVDDNLVAKSIYVAPKYSIFKKIIFYFLAKNLFIYLIDNNYFKWFYKPLKFKFYDYVTASFIYYYPLKVIN